jgi:hypothetical protein
MPAFHDDRCLADGAYSRDLRTGILYRCLGSRLQAGQSRVGFEDVLCPDETRWVNPRSVLVQRLRFVKQGDPSTGREVVEAML